MDRHLHRERCVSGAGRVAMEPGDAELLPVGAMIEAGGTLMAATPAGWQVWSMGGYRKPASEESAHALKAGPVRLLTPASTVAALREGYRPQFHPSAAA